MIKSKRIPDIIAICFFVCYVIIGFSIVGDYGLTWDDPPQRFNGIRSIEYLIFHDYEPLRQSIDRDHGPAFEMALYLIERILHINDTHSIFLMRHTMVFIYMSVCMVFFYLLIRRLFANKWMPLIGCLMLILHPRIFADSFYNSKDITAMGGMIVGMFTLVLLSEKPSWIYILLHAFVSAWCIDIRIHCLMLPAATVGILLYKNMFLQKQPIGSLMLKILAYLILTFAFMIPMWPILMDGPFYHLATAIEHFSHYPYYHRLNLFLGKFYMAGDTPGQFQLVAFFMTTPVVYSLLFFTGLYILAKELFKNKSSFNTNIYIWLSLGFYIVSPAAMWYMHSLVLAGWRHIFVIYPFFLIVCMFAVNRLFEMGARARSITAMVIASSFAFNIGMLFYLHPFEYVYYNPIAVQCFAPIDKNFEMDYNGVSFKQGLEYLIKTQYKDKPLKVYVSHTPGRHNYTYLPSEDTAKIHIIEFKQEIEADYYLNMHRWDDDRDTILNRNLIYEFRRQGNRILSVYKLQ